MDPNSEKKETPVKPMVYNLDDEIKHLTEVKKATGTPPKPQEKKASGAELDPKKEPVKPGDKPAGVPVKKVSIADLCVELFDMGQQLGCKYLHSATSLTAEQRQHLK